MEFKYRELYDMGINFCGILLYHRKINKLYINHVKVLLDSISRDSAG